MRKHRIKKRRSSNPFSYAKLSSKVRDFEKRWSQIFRDLDGKMIESELFDRLELDKQSEYYSLKINIIAFSAGYSKKRNEYETLDQLLDDVNNRIMSYMAKARATSTSIWKDKDRDVLKTSLVTIGKIFSALKEALAKNSKRVD